MSQNALGISLPLKPHLAAVALMRALGGVGSGNFDHSGRPGEVGGSGSGGTVTKDEIDVVKMYQGSADPPDGLFVVDGFNGLLRGTNKVKPTPEQAKYYKKQSDVLKRTIGKTVTTEDQIMYRGISSELSSKLKDGMIFTDKGFTSLTSDRKIAEDRFSGFSRDKGRVYEVRIPKGTPLLDVDKLVNPTNSKEYTTEKEHLLGHGTKFQVSGSILMVLR